MKIFTVALIISLLPIHGFCELVVIKRDPITAPVQNSNNDAQFAMTIGTSLALSALLSYGWYKWFGKRSHRNALKEPKAITGPIVNVEAP